MREVGGDVEPAQTDANNQKEVGREQDAMHYPSMTGCENLIRKEVHDRVV